MMTSSQRAAALDVTRDRPASIPSTGAAVRLAAEDWYFHSAVMLVANVVWGIGLVLTYVASLAHPMAGVVAAVLLALPTSGLFRVAASIVRGEEGVAVRDAFRWRRNARLTLAVGVGLVLLAVVASVDLSIGLGSGDLTGMALATFAAWGALGALVVACCWWPVASDPRRDDLGGRAIIRIACMVAAAYPRRLAALLLVVVVVVALSSVLFVALLTISMGFVALLLSRVVLSMADVLTDQRPLEVDSR
jgi:hypothetical protein